MRRATVAAVLTMLIAGCGGDDSNSDGSATAPAAGETIPADEWARRAEELCDEGANRAERAVLELQREAQNQGLSREEFTARLLERSAELSEPTLDRLAALPAPEGKESQARRFEQELRDFLPAVEEMGDAIRDRSESEVQRLAAEAQQAAVSTRALARELNIHACIPRKAVP